MSEVNEAKPKLKPNASLLIRGAIWIAIGALIAAALVCVVWVLVGDQDGLIGRAFLTILLLAAFAGIAILEASLAARRPDWLALTSMITWIVALIAGAIKIWLPEQPGEYAAGVGRFFLFLVIIGVLQLGLLHVRLFTPAAQRYVTTFTRVIYYVTIAMLVLLVAMLVIYLTLPDTFTCGDLYWRFVVALAILTAVGTTLIPLLNALFAPKKREAVSAPPSYGVQGAGPQQYGAVAGYAGAPPAPQWPTYADGVTPLPALADGSPDWNAYHTGYPTPQQAPGYDAAHGYGPGSAYASAQAFPALPEPQHAVPHVPETPQAPAAQQPVTQAQVPVPEQPATPEPAPAQEAQNVPAPEESASQGPAQAGPDQPPTPPAPGAFPPPPPAPRW